METAELCFRLAAAGGTPGDEAAAFETVKALADGIVKLKSNPLGSLVGTIGDGNYKILLDAHLDRIGLLIRSIDENGFLLLSPVGGADARVLTGSEVVVIGKQRLPGVICSTPPHLAKKDDKPTVSVKDMAVDIGMTKEQAQKLVSVGDRVELLPNQRTLLETRIAGSAFDDRCGIAAVLKAAELVKDRLSNTTLCLQLSSQEEVGGGGAKTAAWSFSPYAAIAVDVGFGTDPYCQTEETIRLGGGPSIGISPVLNRSLTKELIETAEKEQLPYQHDVMSSRTGTNADHISLTRCGVPTALLSIPLRHMHTGVEVIDTRDVDNTARLLAAWILAKEAALA